MCGAGWIPDVVWGSTRQISSHNSLDIPPTSNMTMCVYHPHWHKIIHILPEESIYVFRPLPVTLRSYFPETHSSVKLLRETQNRIHCVSVRACVLMYDLLVFHMLLLSHNVCRNMTRAGCTCVNMWRYLSTSKPRNLTGLHTVPRLLYISVICSKISTWQVNVKLLIL